MNKLLPIYIAAFALLFIVVIVAGIYTSRKRSIKVLSEKEAKKLYVVTCISNPRKYKSRYRLYKEFKEYMSTVKNVELYTVEHAYKDRPFEITEENNPYNIQVRGDQEFWHKENLLNIGLSHLPEDAKYIAWIDADVRFLSPTWVEDTIAALDSYDFVQMFSEYIDLGPKGEHLSKMTSFVYSWKHNDVPVITKANGYNTGCKGATGLAWAATREALNNIGGIPDYNIVGAGDWHLAYALIGQTEATIQPWFSDGYKKLLKKNQRDCDLYVNGNVGYVNGIVVHYWHGPKVNRGYNWRWVILKNHNFDPIFDLKKDCQGLYIVNKEKTGMLKDLRDYFISRDEDCMEIK